MAPAATSAQPAPKSKKEKEREKREKAAQQQTERLKVVVRRLPPNLPEDIFWQTVQKWVTEETTTWKVFYPGKFKKRDNKENVPSRAYVAFKDNLGLATFSREFDGHLFRDKAGNESYAIVEFAPYQKVPQEKKKPDNKNATIEKDEDYISFIQSLNAPANAEPVTIDSLLAATRPASPPKTTPLLEALKAEKSAQKDKEAILRNHAHYKDQANVTVLNGMGASSRKEEKKKAAAQNAQAQGAKQQAPASTQAISGKKAKKAKDAPKPSAPAGSGTNPPQEVKGANTSGPSAPKPPRQPKQPKAAPANPTPAPAAPVTIVQAPKPPPASVPAPEVASAKPVADPAAPAAPPARRMRPMFSGRNFEAALAGVGARPKRERPEGNAPSTPTQAQAPTSSPEAAGAGTGDPSDTKEKNPTASPPRSRNRRGGGAAAAPPGAPNIGPKVAPAALQSDPGVVNGSGSPTVASASLPTPAASGSADRGGRGGRRGRGRGGGVMRGAPRGG